MPNFTNEPRKAGIRTGSSLVESEGNAYVARGGSYSTLTSKEREARRISRMTKTADGSYGFPSNSLSGASTVMSGTSNFFSVQLSTDFLELPQSARERREVYRHFYNADPIVGQAIDLHTELPLSKVRLAAPKPITCPEGFKSPDNYGKYILFFFQKMCDRINIFQRLILGVHHFWLDGNCVAGHVRVATQDGEKKISDVLVGDSVLTHHGRWQPVQAVQQREVGGLLCFDIARLPDSLDVTAEHPVEVIRDGHAVFVKASEVVPGDYARVTWPVAVEDISRVSLMSDDVPVTAIPGGYRVHRKECCKRHADAVLAREGLISWLSGLQSPVVRTRKSLAQQLGVSVSTLNNIIITLDEELDQPYRKRLGPTSFGGGSRTEWLPLSVPTLNHKQYVIDRAYDFIVPTDLTVDADFLYLLGYWLGDGTLARDRSRISWGRGLWNICFGADSTEQLGKIRSILERKLGSACIREGVDAETGVRTLCVRYHPAFVEWWASQFGGTSHGYEKKRIPAWVSCLPDDKLLHLLAGIVDSDGCVSVSTKGQASINLTSRSLIDSFWDILLRLGVVPSLTQSHVKDGQLRGRVVRANHASYSLLVDDEVQCHLLVSKAIKGTKLKEAKRFTQEHPSYIVEGNLVGFKVNSVSPLPGQTVYNLQVAEDHTFRAGFISTHNCFFFAEDGVVDVPQNIGYDHKVIKESVYTEADGAIERDQSHWVERSDREEAELAYYQKHYQGWDKLVILPMDQVDVKTFSFTDKVKVALIPSENDRALIDQAKMGDPVAEEMVQEIPMEVREHIESGRLVPLGTDPDEGSFVYHLKARHGAEEALGHSILDRCLRCHLPETPVLVERAGIIQQVPIAQLDADTDRVLSHTGTWRGFEAGVRSVDEDVSLLHVYKLHPPVACTQDHKHFVLRDGQVVETVAKNILPGDFLQVPQIPLTESINRIDLSLGLHTVEPYMAQRSGVEVNQTVESGDETASSFSVRYTKPETGQKMQRHLLGMASAVLGLKA